MTPTPRCPECHQLDWHKMSCDTGNRLRLTGIRVNPDESMLTFDTTPLLTMPITDSGSTPTPPCPPADTSSPPCGGTE